MLTYAESGSKTGGARPALDSRGAHRSGLARPHRQLAAAGDLCLPVLTYADCCGLARPHRQLAIAGAQFTGFLVQKYTY